MNEDDLTTILQRGVASVGLPADAAGRVQARMHDELDGALGSEAVVVALHRPGTGCGNQSPEIGRRRPLTWIAAAVFLVASVAGLISQREPDIDQAAQAPGQQPYLLACVEFIGSTSVDGQTWRDVLTSPSVRVAPEYLAALAGAIDELLVASREAGAATTHLQAAAAEARTVDSDPGVIIHELELASQLLFEETGISCLIETNQ